MSHCRQPRREWLGVASPCITSHIHAKLAQPGQPQKIVVFQKLPPIFLGPRLAANRRRLTVS